MIRWPIPIAMVLILCPSVVSPQEAQLKRLMRDKLQHAQQILGAVVTSDWTTLEKQSVDLLRVAENPAWIAEFKTPLYARQSEAFLRATEDLVDAAKRHDMEAAPIAYMSLTLTCVQCHRFTARARVVQ